MKHTYLLLILLTGWTACLKPSDSDIQASHSQPFVNSDLKKALSNTASLKLFNQAFVRLGVDKLIDTSKGYTIFAPTDDAMIAAGLNEQVINSLSADSLRKLITYHIVSAALDELALKNTILSVNGATLRSDTTFDQATGFTVTPYTLYVQQTGSFYFNGLPVEKAGDVIPTSNGYIFPISKVLHAFTNVSLSATIASQPDLSLFYAALRINDSIRRDYFMNLWGSFDDQAADLYWFSKPPAAFNAGILPTIFAPTNKAFEDAGFFTEEDLLQYAQSGPAYGYDESFVSFAHTPLDSLMYRHMVYNLVLAQTTNGSSAMLLYGDLLHPTVNNGVFNIFSGSYNSTFWEGIRLQWKSGLNFSADQGKVSMTWNNMTIPIPLPANDESNFITRAGVLYKVDKLFYTKP
jgi:uncharacterized surface protein with fasciclin (FAS1) repeats